jgi:tetratricopeptide (TPR) repeat protein
MRYFEKAVSLSDEPEVRTTYYRQLARLSKQVNNYGAEAHWLGRIYADDPRATNVTLFNWGLAAYKAQDYQQADSVFGLYTGKYPEQGFGYYWRARSNAAIDTAMEQGLAISHYHKLIEVIAKDTLTTTDKKWMKEAFGYLAGYAANTEKDYPEAISYFEKLLAIDPSDEQVQRNIEILEKNLEMKTKTESGSH